jgi:hypothetical protein
LITPTRSILSDTLTTDSHSPWLTRANVLQTKANFTQQLADSLEGYLKQASPSSQVKIDLLPTRSGDSGTRQYLVTILGSEELGAAASTATNPVAPANVNGGTTLTENGLYTNEVDAYWASQPKEVQVLRTIKDWDERGIMGKKLADQGFAIDPNIMIHGWDPYMTMKIRQGEGYTWVPATGQDGIPVSPGLNFPGLPSYDPNKPPAGAIKVTTDFAKGLEHTSPGAGNGNFDSRAQS